MNSKVETVVVKKRTPKSEQCLLKNDFQNRNGVCQKTNSKVETVVFVKKRIPKSKRWMVKNEFQSRNGRAKACEEMKRSGGCFMHPPFQIF